MQLRQWSTIHYIVQRMGSHEEEDAKMIMSMVLVALRNSLKCLSLTCSGQTTLKAYFINMTCDLCLRGGGEASSSLWARFVTEIVAHFRQVFRERQAHVIWSPVGTDHLQGWLWAEEAQATGTRPTKKAKEC